MLFDLIGYVILVGAGLFVGWNTDKPGFAKNVEKYVKQKVSNF